LARFGWGWLGRRSDNPALATLPQVGLDPARQAAAVADARRYGFHATLKPPFRLNKDFDRQDLYEVARLFANERRSFVEPPFVLAELQGFLAIRPSRRSPAIAILADDCVRHFDRFRAAPTDQERSKRLAQHLSERQKQYVDVWGYPYVFEEYRFHMTLSCRLDEAERAVFRQILQQAAEAALAEPVSFRSLCLFEQASAEAPFVLKARFPFGG
jgi:hypothetical protein